MDTTTGEETPLDSAKPWEDSEGGRVDVHPAGNGTSQAESSTPEGLEAEKELGDAELSDYLTTPTVSSSTTTVFATPSASMHILSTASSTSLSPSSSVVADTRIQSTFHAPPSFPLPVPQSTATASLPTPQASKSSPTSGSPMEIPSRMEPFHPLPDIMSALNMRPVAGMKKTSNSSSHTDSSSNGDSLKVNSLGPGSKDVLIDKFRKDPNGVLGLLQSALNMDKLSGLLKEEHLQDSEVLPQLQNRLEAAYHTLRECQLNKETLGEKISETKQKIGEKRKHLEELRGELKILGDEELKLKKQRDISHTKYSELKRRLQCSTEALRQIAVLTKSSHSDTSNATNSSTGSNQRAGTGPSSKTLDALSSGSQT